MVSIIYVLYNTNSKFVASLNSLAHQTYKDTEIIIVGNSKLNECQKVIEKLTSKGAQITTYQVENDSSRLAAYCLGAKKAQGEYLFFMDSSDYIYQSYLEILLKKMEKDAEITLATASFARYRDKKTVAGLNYKEELLIGEKKFDAKEISFYRLWNSVIRKDFFMKVLASNDFSNYHSSILTTALLVECPKYYRHSEVLYFRGSFSDNFSPNIDKGIESVLKCQEFNLPEKIYQNIIIDELLVDLSLNILKQGTDKEKVDKVVDTCKEQIKHLKRKIIFMKRPLLYRRGALAMAKKQYSKAEKLFNRFF